jgi:outer membrane lipopolysaccharide assembly protein LptE/RlpB
MPFTIISREINMDRLKYLLIGILALVLSGCGQTVTQTLNVPQGPDYNAPGSGKSIVILPFADYSQSNLESARRRNMVLTESLTDRLVSSGFGLPIQEDVFDYLVKEKIIQLATYEKANTSTLAIELSNDWSDIMKDQIRHYKAQVEIEAEQKSQRSAGVHGLTAKEVAKIGRHFNADYILRGRILEFKTRQEASWLPWKKGFLPFVIGGTNQFLHGFASTDAYDERNESITGSLLLGVTAFNYSTWPWADGKTLFGMAGNSMNTVVWGTAGYGLGSVSHSSGQMDQAVVQMRIWVQEAATGNVVWTNRVRVQVSPESVYADNQYDTLFNQAIEKGTSTLVDHFVTYGL